ncbi:MAG: hypothetical protein JJLCMIEE_01545 [Acidimicrobiales bacterium]|nr:MAG: hypothetical protein EDR02_04580 [Actinomycetota bacterium]MBV6508482.1 hypothetical protein [Acidimicrobiales bacterium]RIK05200.1 MAG: hypothetical protein DCC48_11330 [Acidobacteriota bacterium]
MRITLPAGTPAELVEPSGTPTRGLVVVPDIGGLRPLFDEHCRRLADENGWVVCAPEPFPGDEDLELSERMERLGSMVDEEKLRDIRESADVTRMETVSIVGFCMGGMYTLKAASTGRFHRAVSFYGMIRVPEIWEGPGQGQPLDYLEQGSSCPILAVIGAEDPWTPAADVDDLEAAGATVVRYAGAEHGFVHDPERPAYRPADAADAWRRATEFLSE